MFDSWGHTHRIALTRMVGTEPSSVRYQRRARARIAKGHHPSIYSERVAHRFASLHSRGFVAYFEGWFLFRGLEGEPSFICLQDEDPADCPAGELLAHWGR